MFEYVLMFTHACTCHVFLCVCVCEGGKLTCFVGYLYVSSIIFHVNGLDIEISYHPQDVSRAANLLLVTTS